jgi:hypothetical protein
MIIAVFDNFENYCYKDSGRRKKWKGYLSGGLFLYTTVLQLKNENETNKMAYCVRVSFGCDSNYAKQIPCYS